MGVVSLAKSLIGKVKYVFGSDNIEGGTGDCSSFTEYVFKKNGIDIGADTELQYLSGGTKINNMSDLQSGDLVFFAYTYASGHVDGVSHVGIYSGNNKFIHCSSGAGNVVESDISSDYYNSHFLSGLRKSGVISEGTTAPSTSVSADTKEVDLSLAGNIAKYVIIILLILLIVGSLVLTVTSSLD